MFYCKNIALEDSQTYVVLTKVRTIGIPPCIYIISNDEIQRRVTCDLLDHAKIQSYIDMF